MKRSSETEEHKKQRQATPKIEARYENEFERNLRMVKVVACKQVRLAAEAEEERRARLENDAATKGPRDGRRKKSKTGDDYQKAQDGHGD